MRLMILLTVLGALIIFFSMMGNLAYSEMIIDDHGKVFEYDRQADDLHKAQLQEELYHKQMITEYQKGREERRRQWEADGRNYDFEGSESAMKQIFHYKDVTNEEADARQR